MPAEKSVKKNLFWICDEFSSHIEEFDPTFLKVLVRYNPESDETSTNATQRPKNSEWLPIKANRPFLFDSSTCNTYATAKLGFKEVYDTQLRPELMVESINQIQDAGVEPAFGSLKE
jgi:hypothetical protein